MLACQHDAGCREDSPAECRQQHRLVHGVRMTSMAFSSWWTLWLSRMRPAARDALTAACAAALAWMLAQYLYGQPRPLFAAVTAVVCLAPGLPNHGQQSIIVVLGVVIGMVLGELTLMAPVEPMLFKVAVATFASMLVASSFGFAAVVPIQAGVSAILILAFGPETAGVSRLLDVLVGCGVGLLFSQVLLTPDPVRLVNRAVHALLWQLAQGLTLSAEALREGDWHRAEVAMRRISAAYGAVQVLDAAITEARKTARWSLRGRWMADAVHEVAARYDRRGNRLYASTLLLAEALGDGLRKSTEQPENGLPPRGLQERLDALATRCTVLADASGGAAYGAVAGELPWDASEGIATGEVYKASVIWQGCEEHLETVWVNLNAFAASHSR